MELPLIRPAVAGMPTRKPTVPLRQLRPAAPRSRLRWNFAEWFILSQTFLPALLYLPGAQPIRVIIRVASYGISLLALLYYWSSAKDRPQLYSWLHPSAPWLLAALAYLGLMMLHPATNSFLAGTGQILLYLAIFAPVLWAPACMESPQRLQRLLWLLLICNGINAFVGVMQVRDPDTWMPREFSSNLMESEFGLGTAIYEGANGNIIIRPPGLGDAPGAVCGPAVFALFLGLVMVVSERSYWKKAVAVIFAWLGAQAIFLSLVRSSFLIAIGMVVVFVLLQLLRGKSAQASALVLVAVGAVTFAFIQSVSLGGESLLDRFKTITAEDPLSFYQENRGNQVAAGFSELLPQYPFGAGLGRYGMMGTYFGDRTNLSSQSIWVEVQWPAWIVDGGVIMLLLYPAGLIVAMWRQSLVSLSDDIA